MVTSFCLPATPQNSPTGHPLGLYVTLFGGSIYVLLYRRPNTYHLGASISLFLLTTAYTGICLAMVIVQPIITSNSYVKDLTTLPCVPETPARLHEALMGNLLTVIKNIMLTCMSVIADGILLYRCVVLWPHRRWVGIPLGLLLTATAAMNIASVCIGFRVYHLSQQLSLTTTTLPHGWIEAGNTLLSVTEAATILQLIDNAMATALIASRIWFVARQMEKVSGRVATAIHRNAMSIIIESGLLLFVSQLVDTCVLFASPGGQGGPIVSDICQLMTVIAPTLIIVRVGLGQTFDNVVDSAHHYHANNTQVGSIRFADRRAFTTGVSHSTSLGVVIPNTALEFEGDARSSGSGTAHSYPMREIEDVTMKNSDADVDCLRARLLTDDV
ncbi:hypothetical protein DENSPDRAFT_316931 [Dentipellis sp. KUC8613]|nr:hypothetical protein DENSPDRAFT_316931 [Dentipellis sp. KUC8613]